MRVLLLLAIVTLVSGNSCHPEATGGYERPEPVSLHMQWLHVTTTVADQSLKSKANHSRPPIEDLIMGHIQTYSKEFTSISLGRTNYSTSDHTMTKISVNATIEASAKKGYLRILGRMADCNEPCIAGPDDNSYELSPSKEFRMADSGINGLPIILIGKIIVVIGNEIGTSPMMKSAILPKGTRDNSCKLCKDISDSQISFTRRAIDWLWWLVVSIKDLLEPTKWLALIISIWLIICLVIAIIIKRRDRRRLRIYLAEREDYSFSTKRQVSD